MFRSRREFLIKVDDTKPNVGIGVTLPFTSTSVFNTSYTTKDQVKSNLINFLLTNRGERPFNPQFGADIRRFLFEQTTSSDELKSIIQDKIGIYIPQITVLNLEIERVDNSHTIIIHLGYSVNNQEDQVTIQFV